MLTQDCSRRSLLGAAAVGILSVRGPARPAQTGQAATVILFRHAEKETDGRDPDLTRDGEERAEALARMLREANVTRIFSTDTRRTRATVAPLAEQLEIEIEPYKTRGFAVKLGAMKGETVAVSGHSNTVPAIARALGGELAGLTDDGHFPDDQYDRVIIQTLWSPEDEDPMRAIQTLDLRLDPCPR